MNYLKIQQDIMAEMHDPYYRNTGRAPHYCKEHNLLTNTYGSAVYIIPQSELYLNPEKLKRFEGLPFDLYNPNKWEELTATTESHTENKKNLIVYKCGEREVFIDLRLLKPFAKGVKFYQEKDLRPIAVIEKGVLVAYVMPCQRPKNK